MKLVKFSIPDQIEAWEKLESAEGIEVKGVYRFDSFVIVKYSSMDERVDRELEELEHVKHVAGQVSKDQVLPTLKNATQRELYLLEKYNIDSYTGNKVWEYMKLKVGGA